MRPTVLPGCEVLPPLQTKSAETQQVDQGRRSWAKGRLPRRKTGDRFAVLNAFVDFTMRNLSRAEALTWLALWRDTKTNGVARTSQADLARRMGVNVSTVKRAVAALAKSGLLVVVCRGSLRQGPSAYRVRPLPDERLTPGVTSSRR